MSTLTRMTRTWPMLSALGGGLVLLAISAGSDALGVGLVVGALGAASLVWSGLSLRAGRMLLPGVVLGVSLGVLLGAGVLAFSGAAAASGIAGLPLVVAAVFALGTAVGGAIATRTRTRRGGAPARQVSVIGLALGAMLVAGLATPALAATEAGDLAVPHGEHGTSEGGAHGGH